MISCDELFAMFKENDLTFFAGVPDSTFKDWMSFLAAEHGKSLTNIVACNECEAVAIAVGYHLSTGKLAVVYMQNSGEGKTVNPLTSLCDPEVYSIPLILMIGWRGKPGTEDEPQHKKMGRITMPLLDTLEIPYRVLPDELSEAKESISEMRERATENNEPVALVIKRGTIQAYETWTTEETHLEMKREDAIKIIVDRLEGSEIIVSTTGKTSRELFEYRIGRNEAPRDFYTVGGMGCASSIALAVALEKPDRNVVVFDGDGAALMQMGSMATMGHYRPANLKHILFDNEAHDSTGGQMTVSGTVDFEKIARACGYRYAKVVASEEELVLALEEMKTLKGPRMLVVQVKKGARPELGRPTTTPVENKKEFMKFLTGN